MIKRCFPYLFAVLALGTWATATTVDFSVYGPTQTCCGNAVTIGNTSISFPGGTVSSSELQVDSPGWFGATVYEVLGNGADLLVNFTSPVSAFSADLRDFVGYSDNEVINAYDASNNLISTQTVSLSTTPIVYSVSGNISEIDFGIGTSGWTGLLQDFTYPNTSPVPEPSSLALFGSGLFGLAGAVRRRMKK